MSAWKDDDEVTTTYGSIKLAQAQAFQSGVNAFVELLKVRSQSALLQELDNSDPLIIAGHFAVKTALNQIIDVIESSNE
jgi:hypothetical protein